MNSAVAAWAVACVGRPDGALSQVNESVAHGFLGEHLYIGHLHHRLTAVEDHVTRNIAEQLSHAMAVGEKKHIIFIRHTTRLLSVVVT